MRGTLADRFWAKVQRVDDATSCWLWTAATDTKGYGQIRDADGRLARAPRVSWELEHGPIPEGQHVLHACDTPPCVRPDHLFLGTNDDNVADAIRKGRSKLRCRGEQVGNSKLKTTDVIAIRAAHAAGENCGSIARRYAVTDVLISKIVKRRIWKHVEASPCS